MAFLKIVLFFLVMTVALVSGTPTYCKLINANSQYSCSKSYYRPDRIFVENIGNGQINFKVTKKWSICGQQTTTYANEQYCFGPGSSINVQFEGVGFNTCNQLIISDCKINGISRKCRDAVALTPY